MSSLDTIVGTRGKAYRVAPQIVCKDGFKVSVQASSGHYCTDALGGREFYWDNGPAVLPYSTVEVGYPSERPEPWRCTAWGEGFDNHEDHPRCDGWQGYAEDPDGEDGGGVFAFVPVVMVRALIESHGGEA